MILVIASTCFPLGVGVAGAVSQEKRTANGYVLTLSLDDVAIQSVPNMAAAPLVREGFITATSRLVVKCWEEAVVKDCGDDREPVSATVSMFAQVGCQTDLSAGFPLAPTVPLAASLPDTLGQLLPTTPNGITDIGIAPSVQNAQLGSLEVKAQPGYIRDVELGTQNVPPTSAELDSLNKSKSLAKKALEVTTGTSAHTAAVAGAAVVGQRIAEYLDRSATGQNGLVVSVLNRHIVVGRHTGASGASGACGGPVAIRLQAVGTIKTLTPTASSSDKISVYGDIFSL